MIRASFFRLASLPILLTLVLPARSEPQWIWTSKNARSQEKATFRKSFVIDGVVKRATLSLTCDNGATALLNGAQVARNPDWMDPTKADVTKWIKTGENELRIEAKNIEGI